MRGWAVGGSTTGRKWHYATALLLLHTHTVTQECIVWVKVVDSGSEAPTGAVATGAGAGELSFELFLSMNASKSLLC